MTKKLLIAGGGTGGHLFPGLAVAEEWQARGGQVVFVGTPKGLEKDLVPKHGFPLRLLEIRALKGAGISMRLKSLAMLPKALLESRKILKEEAPDVVLGIGGYASGPTVLTARLLGFKAAVIDQNSMPGLTNRILGKFVDRVFLNFEGAAPFFKKDQIRLVGNPVLKRRRLWEKRTPPPKEAPMLLVCGGSQGARRLNQVMTDAAQLLLKAVPNLKIAHQTGAADFEMVSTEIRKKGLPVEVFAFSDKLEDYYRSASLVVSRSGAGMLTEIACWGLPSLLVPFPFAADDHQKLNALELVNRNAAEMIEQSALTPQVLTERVAGLLADPEKLRAMSEAAFAMAKPDAAEKVVDDLVNW